MATVAAVHLVATAERAAAAAAALAAAGSPARATKAEVEAARAQLAESTADVGDTAAAEMATATVAAAVAAAAAAAAATAKAGMVAAAREAAAWEAATLEPARGAVKAKAKAEAAEAAKGAAAGRWHRFWRLRRRHRTELADICTRMHMRFEPVHCRKGGPSSALCTIGTLRRSRRKPSHRQHRWHHERLARWWLGLRCCDAARTERLWDRRCGRGGAA